MHLIIITNLFPNPLDPHRSTFNYKQIKALSKYHEITVISPISWLDKLKNYIKRKNVSEYNVIKWNGINVRYPSYFYIPGCFRILNGYFMYYSISTVFYKIQIKKDTMIIGTWLYPDSFAAVLLADKINKKCIIKVHGSDVEEMKTSKVKRIMSVKTLKKADAIISVSKYLSKIINIYYPNEKTFVVYNGVDKSVFNSNVDDSSDLLDNLSNLKTNFIGLYVGNFKKDKGIIDLLQAIDVGYCRENSLSLVIIGDGTEKENIKNIIESKKISKYVNLLSQVPSNVVAKWMSRVNFTCLPSYHEGLPNVLLESIACGTPVIATDVGGISEIINVDNGILISPGDIENLKIAIKKIITKKWDKEKIIRSIEFSSWDENALKFNNVIESYND